MIDRILINQIRTNRFPASILESRDSGNGPVIQCDPSKAPPAPPDGNESDGFARMTRHMADKASSRKKSFASQLAVDQTRKVRAKAEAKGERREFAPRCRDAGKCPHCGCEKSTSKGYNKPGNQQRRICDDCGKTWSREEESGSAA